MEIVIASSNLHKVREFRSLLKHLAALEIFSLNDFPNYAPPEETGSSFEENALLKALAASKQLKKWVIADDSGLVVPVLGNAPGVFSARYAGPDATDLDNRRKLLKELQGKTPLERSAYYECVIVLADPEGNTKTAKGICEGTITLEEKGRNGFGYDPIFIKHDYNLTFGELDESVKNRVSHRRKALDKLLLILESLIQSSSPANQPSE